MNATTRTNTQACEICMFVTSDEPIYYLCRKIRDCNFLFFSSSSFSPFISCDFEWYLFYFIGGGCFVLFFVSFVCFVLLFLLLSVYVLICWGFLLLLLLFPPSFFGVGGGGGLLLVLFR